VAIEALAHGRPIMVNQGTSFASTVSENFGWCIQPTIDSWCKAIEMITQEDIQTRGPAARKHYVETCSPSAAMTSLVKIYTDLLGRDR
jgi:glycosyltransferase involved in cell wall biosynthesis